VHSAEIFDEDKAIQMSKKLIKEGKREGKKGGSRREMKRRKEGRLTLFTEVKFIEAGRHSSQVDNLVSFENVFLCSLPVNPQPTYVITIQISVISLLCLPLKFT
jgi:hypothetical protein